MIPLHIWINFGHVPCATNGKCFLARVFHDVFDYQMSSCLVISSRVLATSLFPSSISASLAESCRSFHSRKSNDKCWVPVHKIIMEIYFACLLVAVFLHRSRCQTQPSGALSPGFWAKKSRFWVEKEPFHSGIKREAHSRAPLWDREGSLQIGLLSFIGVSS